MSDCTPDRVRAQTRKHPTLDFPTVEFDPESKTLSVTIDGRRFALVKSDPVYDDWHIEISKNGTSCVWGYYADWDLARDDFRRLYKVEMNVYRYMRRLSKRIYDGEFDCPPAHEDEEGDRQIPGHRFRLGVTAYEPDAVIGN